MDEKRYLEINKLFRNTVLWHTLDRDIKDAMDDIIKDMLKEVSEEELNEYLKLKNEKVDYRIENAIKYSKKKKNDFRRKKFVDIR